MASQSSSTQYSEKDIITMQQDAIRRAREMQARAMQAVEHANSAKQPVSVNKPYNTYGNAEQGGRQFQPQGSVQQNNSFAEQKPPPMQGNNQTIHNNNINSFTEQKPPPVHNNNPAHSGQQINGLPFNLGSLLGEGKSLTSMLGSFIGNATEKTKIGEVLKALDLDTEKLIIIGLMIILYNEGADAILLIALGYLLI